MSIALYLEWVLAPLTWAGVCAFASFAIGVGFDSLGRLTRTIAGRILLAESALLFGESRLRSASAQWAALPGGRLAVEAVAVGSALLVALIWRRSRRAVLESIVEKGAVERRTLGAGAAALLLVTGLACAQWLLPPFLRPSLSLAREQGADPAPSQSVREMFELVTRLVWQDPLRELMARTGDAAPAVVTVLRGARADGGPSYIGTDALMGLLGSLRVPLATAELERWMRWEQAAPSFRARAMSILAQAGENDAVLYAGDLLGRIEADPAWRGSRSLVLVVAVRSPSAHGSAALRAVLRSDHGTSEDYFLPFVTLAASDAVEDRAAVLDFFLDEARFGTIASSPGGHERLDKAMRPLLSELLEDGDPLTRKRACEQLVGDRPEARQWKADLWNELHGYPCMKLQKADLRVQVAASIRRSLNLGVARPPLPREDRLPPLEHPDRAPKTCHVDRFDGQCGDVYSIAISPDATLAATVGGLTDDEADQWDLSTQRRVWTLGGAGASGIAFEHDRSLIVTWSTRYGASAYDTETGERTKTLPPCTATPAPTPMPAGWSSRRRGAGAVSPDGSLVVTGGDAVCLWSGSDGTLVRRIAACAPSDDLVPTAVAFSSDGATLALACAHELVLLSTKSGAPIARIASSGQTWTGPIALLGGGGDLRVLAAEASGDSPSEVVVRSWSVSRSRALWAIHLGVRSGQHSFAVGRDRLASWGPAHCRVARAGPSAHRWPWALHVAHGRRADDSMPRIGRRHGCHCSGVGTGRLGRPRRRAYAPPGVGPGGAVLVRVPRALDPRVECGRTRDAMRRPRGRDRAGCRTAGRASARRELATLREKKALSQTVVAARRASRLPS